MEVPEQTKGTEQSVRKTQQKYWEIHRLLISGQPFPHEDDHPLREGEVCVGWMVNYRHDSLRISTRRQVEVVAAINTPPPPPMLLLQQTTKVAVASTGECQLDESSSTAVTFIRRWCLPTTRDR